jgi:hypothetical protein
MKITIDVVEDQDTEQRVWMAAEGFADGLTIGSAYPGNKDTNPTLAGTKLRALKDARSSLVAARRAVEKEIRAETKRLKKEHARRKAEHERARSAKKRGR